MPLALLPLLAALPLAVSAGDEPPALDPGVRVRVTVAESPSRPLVGVLESLDHRALSVRLDGRVQAIPADAIRRIEVSRGHRLSSRWTAVGAVVGGVAGAFIGGCVANKDDYGVLCAGQDDTKYLIGGVAGGLAGGALGAWLGRSERWEAVDLVRREAAAAEARRRCAGGRRTDPGGPTRVLDCR